jgi:hypothetical protein
MSDTTWTSTLDRPGIRRPSVTGRAGRFWILHVVWPLHRALDSALRAGELRSLDPSTLTDIGYRRD